LLDFLLHSRHLFLPTRIGLGNPARAPRVGFGFALLPALSIGGVQALPLKTYSFRDTLGHPLSFNGTLGLAGFHVLRTPFGFSSGVLSVDQAIREFLDLATRVQVMLFPETLALQGIQAFSGEKLALLLLHTGLPLLLLSQDIQLDLSGPGPRGHGRIHSSDSTQLIFWTSSSVESAPRSWNSAVVSAHRRI
ncbi:hypothetical protein PHYSODRAFT_534893, partial [Phytophthora sojae]